MTKRQVWQIYLFSLMCLFTACDDKENNEESGIKAEVNGMYSNKSAAALTKDSLLLTYNGDALYGKEVYFKLTSEDVAELTLFGVLPGEKEQTLSNVSLIKKADAYHFTGNGTSPNGISYEYTGEVEKGKLSLDMENVKVRENLLATAGKWNIVQAADRQDLTDAQGSYRYYKRSAYLLWDPVPQGSILIGQVPSILRALVEKIVYSTLQDVSFSADGNVTATYALLPDTTVFQRDFLLGQGFPNRPTEDWNLSSRQLVNYYVKDSKVYVIPNAEMIIREIQNQTRGTRADNILGIDIDFDTIMEAYTRITEWFTTGIALEIREIPSSPVYSEQEGRRIKYEGDIMLILDKSELEPFLPLLSLVKELLSEEVLNNTAISGLTVGELIDVIMDGLVNSDTLEIGICLNRSSN